MDHPEILMINRNFQYLQALFPKSNQRILMKKCQEFGSDDEAFHSFVEMMLDDPSPLLEKSDEGEFVFDKYTKMMEEDAKAIFDPENFLKQIRTSDPLTHFDQMAKPESHKKLMFAYLQKRFLLVKDKDIEKTMKEHNYYLLHVINSLIENPPEHRAFERDDSEINNMIQNCANFVHEVKFVEHFHEIQEYLLLKEDMRKAAKLEQRTLVCECCCLDDIMENEVVTCTEGHIFCNGCVKRYVEVALGEAKTEFQCLEVCSGTIPLDFIKELLSVAAYLKLCAKIQEAEIKAAKIPGIEYCIQCEYGAIPAQDDPYLFCQACKINICRKCRKEEHAPLKCGESLQDYNNKIVRINKEETATKVILRKCPSCSKSYVKESGCNVIRCQCGSVICYNCSKLIHGLTDPHTHTCGGTMV